MQPSDLACPKCLTALRAEAAGSLLCPTCRSRYPLLEGIPSFLVPAPTAGQSATALSVVIPAIDEARNLERLLPELRAELDRLAIASEVIVVDGGSTDGTAEVALRYGASVVRKPQPGYGEALRAGFASSGGDYLLTLDADGSHDVSFLGTLWEARATAEVVIASRYVTGGSADMPPWRSVLSRVLNLVFRAGLSLPARDVSSGYRLYGRRVIAELDLRARDFDVLEEILIRALSAGYRVREVPLRYRARMSGRSHARLFAFALSCLRTFLAMWRLRNSIASADYDARAYHSLIPLQRYWQRRRYGVITRMAGGFRRILDVGCGSSRILAFSAHVTGLDVLLPKLRFSRRYGNPLVHASIFALPFQDGSFDCVICSEVIEHIPADEKAFSELRRVLCEGGRLILGTPDYDRWRWRALEWLYARLAPGGYADEHITHYGRRNLAAYLGRLGFAVERIEYVGGAEMIFSLRKLPAASLALEIPSIASALRDAEAA